MSLITNKDGHWVAADGTFKPEPPKAEKAEKPAKADAPKPDSKPDATPKPEPFTVGVPPLNLDGGKR